MIHSLIYARRQLQALVRPLAALLRGVMELAKRLREFRKLMVGIETTRIWKNPELRWA